MIADCEAGKIDIILTKSISRFARNTVDLLAIVRHLKEMGIEVRFEKECIKERSQRKGCSGVTIFSSKIRCGCCGGWYGPKVWHSTDKYRRVIWQCNSKFKKDADEQLCARRRRHSVRSTHAARPRT